MSNLALGNPVVAYAYKYDAKGSAFNKLFYNILSPGIYTGGGLSFSGNQIIVDSYDALFPYPTTSQIIAVHTNSSINLSSSVGEGGYGLGNITSSLPYIAMYFIWTDSTGVYPDYGFYDESVTSNASYIVLGKATFTGSNVTGFDYSASTYPPRYNSTTRGLNVRGLTDSTSTSTGSVVINGGVGIAKNLVVGNTITASNLTANSKLEIGSTDTAKDSIGLWLYGGNGTVAKAYNYQFDIYSSALRCINASTGTVIWQSASSTDNNVTFNSGLKVTDSSGWTLDIKGNGIVGNTPNIHLDATGAGASYVNYYSGTGGTNFCNGAGLVTANVSNTGGIFSNSSAEEARVGVENKQKLINTYLFSNNTGRGLWDSSAGDIIRRNWTDSAWTFTGNLTGNAVTSNGTAFIGQDRDASAEYGIATEWDGSRQYIHGWRRGTTNAKSGYETRVNYADNAATSSSCTGNAATATHHKATRYLHGSYSDASAYSSIISYLGDTSWVYVFTGRIGTTALSRAEHTAGTNYVTIYGGLTEADGNNVMTITSTSTTSRTWSVAF